MTCMTCIKVISANRLKEIRLSYQQYADLSWYQKFIEDRSDFLVFGIVRAILIKAKRK